MFGMHSIPSSVHEGGIGYGYNTHGEQKSSMTPGSTGPNREGPPSEGEKDPFLNLLEQLAENENSRGEASELDFFLSRGNG